MIETPTQVQAASAMLNLSEIDSIKPSAHLLELCHAYLDLVDNGTREQQGEERTRAHNALIEQMVQEKIVAPSPHRVLVRWLARYLTRTDFLQHAQITPQSYVMFLRRGSFPPKLEYLPPFYEKEEPAALDFYVPVRVTIEPLFG